MPAETQENTANRRICHWLTRAAPFRETPSACSIFLLLVIGARETVGEPLLVEVAAVTDGETHNDESRVKPSLQNMRVCSLKSLAFETADVDLAAA
jgi:hypothetical protein